MSKATEEVTRRNVIAIKEFTEVNRDMVRKMEEKVEFLSKQVATQESLLKNINNQIAVLHRGQMGTGPTA